MFVDGPIWVEGPARRASVSKLRLTSSDLTYPIPLKVLADDVRVTRNTITGSSLSTICVLVGSHRVTHRTVIERNSISRCGTHSKFDHLIYLSNTRGARIRHNLLTANGGGWAVHMYPDADRTLVERNTIDGNLGGVVFAGDGSGKTSDRNVVRRNAITFSGPRWSIESSWSGGPHGRGNRRPPQLPLQHRTRARRQASGCARASGRRPTSCWRQTRIWDACSATSAWRRPPAARPCFAEPLTSVQKRASR